MISNPNTKLRYFLYLLSVLGSGLGFTIQILVSGFWSTTFSQDIYYFSINTSFYFLAMGLGSLLSKKINPEIANLFWLIVILSILGAGSIGFLRAGIGLWGEQVFMPLSVVMLTGICAGVIIPLVLRIGEGLGITLGKLFFLDYSAALVFTLFFTHVLLIPMGYGRSAIFVSGGVYIIAISSLTWLKQLTPRYLFVAWGLLAIIPASWFVYKKQITLFTAPKLASGGGQAKIIYSEQSHYQKIVLTEETPVDEMASMWYTGLQHVLYLDGFVQLSSIDEQNYHICLANIPMAAVSFGGHSVKKALILGGGDGLAARNLLVSPSVKQITLVELDPSMIRLAKSHPVLQKYNLKSLANPRVKVITEDAFLWVGKTQEKFDLILVDFPAPKNHTLARLFSREFYYRTFKLLEKHGMASIQAGPSYALEDPTRKTLSKVTASIQKTVASVGYYSYPYVTPSDSEAFVLVTPDPNFSMQAFSDKVGLGNEDGMGALCRYNAEWVLPEVEVNALNTLKLANYMIDWFHTARGPFFKFTGDYAVFLPE